MTILEGEYILTQDDDCHWYLLPKGQLEAFDKWLDLDTESDEFLNELGYWDDFRISGGASDVTLFRLALTYDADFPKSKGMSYNQYEYWDVECSMSKKNLSSVLFAVIMCHGAVTDTFTLAQDCHSQYDVCRDTAFFRIKLPVMAREKFEKLSGLTCKKPPKFQLNSTKEN